MREIKLKELFYTNEGILRLWQAENFSLAPNHLNNFCDASIVLTEDSSDFIIKPMFYHFGHFSKFIARGSRRIDSKIVGRVGINEVFTKRYNVIYMYIYMHMHSMLLPAGEERGRGRRRRKKINRITLAFDSLEGPHAVHSYSITAVFV